MGQHLSEFARQFALVIAGVVCCNLETNGAYIRERVFRVSSAAKENAARQTPWLAARRICFPTQLAT
jgi:hypothetical protein